MPRLARRITLATMVAIAVLLHFTLCIWKFGVPQNKMWINPRIFGWGETFRAGSPNGTVATAHTGFGLFAREHVSLGEGAALGVAVLWLCWRGHDRLASGRCPRCAHALDSNGPRGCPECGWNRAAIGPIHGGGVSQR